MARLQNFPSVHVCVAIRRIFFEGVIWPPPRRTKIVPAYIRITRKEMLGGALPVLQERLLPLPSVSELTQEHVSKNRGHPAKFLVWVGVCEWA